MNDALDAEVIEILRATKNKIEAVKRIRERTGCGLREAKDRADRLWIEAGFPPPAVSDRSLLLILFLAAVVGALYAAWRARS
ncbi:MAG TPA: hypothetical protein VEI02_09010 [Planctomycetota bacterium]|nr:hypothetical protein [Planctomycetota bacterium]